METTLNNQTDSDSSSSSKLLFTGFQVLLEKYDYFLFDCDGVLWNGDQQVEGAFRALREIQRHHRKRIFLITNNSSRTRQQLIEEKLKKFDLELDIKYIYSSVYTTAKYLKKTLNDEEASVYAVGQPGMKEELQLNGVKVHNVEDEREPFMSGDEITTYDIDPKVKAVVAGINWTFTYRKLCIATLYIQMNKAKFIATNQDRVYTTGVPDRKMPAGGSIVAAIQCATQQEPLLIGKPEPMMFDLLREEHGLQETPLDKFLMVGDNLETDIIFGNRCGIDTLLVLTGNTSEEKAQNLTSSKIDSEGTPTLYAPYFGHETQ